MAYIICTRHKYHNFFKLYKFTFGFIFLLYQASCQSTTYRNSRLYLESKYFRYQTILSKVLNYHVSTF